MNKNIHDFFVWGGGGGGGGGAGVNGEHCAATEIKRLPPVTISRKKN